MGENDSYTEIKVAPDYREAIAREFCALEGLDPNELVYVSAPSQVREAMPGVFVTNTVHIVPTQVPYWQSLLPEIDRMIKLHTLIHRYLG